jgi:hypothetical protein
MGNHPTTYFSKDFTLRAASQAFAPRAKPSHRAPIVSAFSFVLTSTEEKFRPHEYKRGTKSDQ